jgi:hypothetical protein
VLPKQNKKTQKFWGCGSSRREYLQVQDPEFKTPVPPKIYICIYIYIYMIYREINKKNRNSCQDVGPEFKPQ